VEEVELKSPRERKNNLPEYELRKIFFIKKNEAKTALYPYSTINSGAYDKPGSARTWIFSGYNKKTMVE
jgi:hypothetical protein